MNMRAGPWIPLAGAAVLAAYPTLVRADVLACLAYAAEMTRERILPIDITG